MSLTDRASNPNEKPAVPVSNKPPNARRTDALIRLTDLALATGLLIAVGLPMVFIALAIRIDDRGPVFFRQTRVGKNLETFSMVKFRTMTVDPSRGQGAETGGTTASSVFETTKAGDARITRVGRVLRPLHLDELPQVLNVFFGSMSIVGVRPDVPVQESQYTPEEWQERHILRPGITGLAQIDPTVNSMQTRTARDLNWVNTRSYGLYWRTLWGTVKKVLKRNSL